MDEGDGDGDGGLGSGPATPSTLDPVVDSSGL